MKNKEIEMKIEKIKEYSKDNVLLNAKIIFNFEGVTLNNELLDELAENIDATWSNEGNYKVKYYENTIIRELDWDWFDESYDTDLKRSVEKEMITDAKKLFVRQIILDKGVYFEYQEVLEEFLTKHDDPRMYDKQYIKKAANNYEQKLETYTLTEINNFCEKSLKDEILKDIEDDYYVF